MTRLILKGPAGCQWDLGSGFRQAGVVVNLTPAEMKKAIKEKLVEKEIDKIKIEKPAKKKFTEKEIYDMNKAEQVIELEKLGITKVPKLEKDRVKAILGAQ